MRVTDIIRKLSQPPSSESSQSNTDNHIGTQEASLSSSPDAQADVGETKEAPFHEAVTAGGDEKIQQTLEGEITMPLSGENSTGSGYLQDEQERDIIKQGIAQHVLYKQFQCQPGGSLTGNDAGILQIWKAVNDFLLDISENRKPDPCPIISTAETIINSLRKNDDIIRVLFAEKQSNDITSHLIDVSIVAAKIGFALGYNNDRMKDLVICALLHDIGLLRVSESILRKKEKLKAAELTEIRKHPQYTLEMLREINGIPPIIMEVTYQIQEREDGSGYPQGLKGDSIHEYAKIIGLAVIYTAMLQPRPQRERKPPFEIIKEIIDKNKAQFPVYLIRILIDELSVFPVGLYVKLNSGEMGRIVRNNRLAPMRPVIEIIGDSPNNRQHQEHREYDLMKEHILRIVDTLFEIT
ncbi:MAG: HD domain-containing protein [Deltaproteobacteria bacterium]|nr:HD domain-containing protein [Deltaproteobacteria bacterium]